MMTATPLSLRWERARQIDRSAIKPLDTADANPSGNVSHVVIWTAERVTRFERSAITLGDGSGQADDFGH